jgi:predicted metal-dependent hydrolase
VTGEIEVVRNARARRLRLSVDPASGRVRLTLPPRASLRKAMRWVEEHGEWIARQQARLPEGRPFAPGARFPLEGEEVEIDWDPARPRTIRLMRVDSEDDQPHPGEGRGPAAAQAKGRDALATSLIPGPRLRQGTGEAAPASLTLVCGGPIEGLPRRIETWLKRRALETLSTETADYAALAGVTVSKVAVADPKSRWGSCASTGVIRYSWRLILAPPHVRRATVAHEVAHRLEMNHSPAFHAHVERLFGSDPGSARAWLKRHGATLHWVGR